MFFNLRKLINFEKIISFQNINVNIKTVIEKDYIK